MILKTIAWLLAVAIFFAQTYKQIIELVRAIKADNESDIAFWGAAIVLGLGVFVWFCNFILKIEKQ